jgi:hypothetical protein
MTFAARRVNRGHPGGVIRTHPSGADAARVLISAFTVHGDALGEP